MGFENRCGCGSSGHVHDSTYVTGPRRGRDRLTSGDLVEFFKWIGQVLESFADDGLHRRYRPKSSAQQQQERGRGKRKKYKGEIKRRDSERKSTRWRVFMKFFHLAASRWTREEDHQCIYVCVLCAPNQCFPIRLFRVGV